MTGIPDPIARGLRTGAQVFVTALLAALYAYLEHIDFSRGIPQLSDLKAAGAVIVFTAVAAVVAWLHNWLENNTAFPALGKPAPPAQNPVPPATPQTTPR